MLDEDVLLRLDVDRLLLLVLDWLDWLDVSEDELLVKLLDD